MGSRDWTLGARVITSPDMGFAERDRLSLSVNEGSNLMLNMPELSRIYRLNTFEGLIGFALSSALIVIAPSSAKAQTRRQSTVVMSNDQGARRFQEEWGYSDAIVTGDTVYMSGVVVVLRDGEALQAAYDRVYRMIGETLARVGASWDDVVDITSYHTDVTEQMEAMVAIHRRYVRAPFPAWTAIDVDRLIPERGITEIKIVARRPVAVTAAPSGGQD